MLMSLFAPVSLGSFPIFSEPRSPHLSEVGKIISTAQGSGETEMRYTGKSRKGVAQKYWFRLPCKGAHGKDPPKNIARHHPTPGKTMLLFSMAVILNYTLKWELVCIPCNALAKYICKFVFADFLIYREMVHRAQGLSPE